MALTNADFRSLLKVGNEHSELDTTHYNLKRKASLKHSEHNPKKESRKLRYIQIQKKKQESNKINSQEDEAQKYRDRADERRKFHDEFYNQIADESLEMANRTVEESKYLGGDIEHTHLVKGLDYALLTKVRNEIKDAQKEAENRSQQVRLDNQNRRIISIKSTTGQSIHKLLFQHLHPHHSAFRDKLKYFNKMILKGIKFKGNTEAFLPGHTCYLYDIGMDVNGEDTPTIIFNSLEDCSKPKEGICLNINSQLLAEIKDILKWHSTNKKKKKNERLLVRPGASKYASAFHTSQKFSYPKTHDDINHQEDDNIYSGIEDFNPEELIKKSLDGQLRENDEKDTQNSKLTINDYEQIDDDFSARYSKLDIIRDEQGMELDEDDSSSCTFYVSKSHPQTESSGLSMGFIPSRHTSEDPSLAMIGNFEDKRMLKNGMTTKDQDQGLHSVFKRDDQVIRKRADQDEREKDPSFISDNYMECYPDYGADISYEVYDSDDDEDRSKMDMGRLKQFGAKKRDFFSSREDWEDYQSTKEALPKAAFQYGRKMYDNRVTRRKKKLNPEEEWKKIEKVIGETSK